MNDTKISNSSAGYKIDKVNFVRTGKGIRLRLGPDKIPLSDLKNAPIYKIDKVRVEMTDEGPRVIMGPYNTPAGVMEITMKKEASALLLQIEDAEICEKTIKEVVKSMKEKANEMYKQGKIITKESDLFSAAEK